MSELQDVMSEKLENLKEERKIEVRAQLVPSTELQLFSD